jgi:hemerythrin superfamily protein
MNLYQLLKQDHQKVKRLFERLGEASDGTAKQRERLFAELKRELELHTAVEEKHFYPALRDRDEARELVEESLEEHGEVKRLLEELDQADKEEGGWNDQLQELQEDVEDHVEEEETELFPIAQKLLGDARSDEIAKAIEKDKAAAQKAGG